MEGGKKVLINEVEHLVGLSKKSIRYYEKHGLLSPTRDDSNDYRIYKDEDIKILKKIKFLRDLGVPIRDLKSLSTGEVSLSECMLDRIKKVDSEVDNYKIVKNICEEVYNSKATYDDIDFSDYSKMVNILGKEGFTLRDTKTSKTKKILGAIISSIIFSTIFIFLIGTVSYFQFTESEVMPWPIYIFIVLILGFPVLGTIYNLIERIKEVLGGEEDEASKY